ncbi:MAG: TonB-dependent receptor plug domain-containing protein [Cyclobacteriaceae bacterium]
MKNTHLKVMVAALLCAVTLTNPALSQDSAGDLYDLSLEDLMNIEIVSASKKSESVFEAPLSSYTLSKDEILQSGATSIPDALRLIPNVIVREQANGVYDVHLRGMDNIPGKTEGVFQPNTTTLVMIDNRPVFNPNMGGTYWEALPIDLNDIERIEVVNGPSAPLFGPNAVAGVINLITKKNKSKGINTSANVQYGNFNTLIGGVRAGYKASKFDIGVSANLESRERTTGEYYQYTGDQFVGSVSELRNSRNEAVVNQDVAFPQPERALQRTGANLFGNYSINESISVGVQAGIQNSDIQKMYFNNGYTPFSFSTSNSQYINLFADVEGVNIRYSRQNTYNDINSVSPGIPFKSDILSSELFVDYTWNIGSKLSIQPGFNVQNVTIDADHYVEEGQTNVLGSKRELQTIAGSLRLDYKITDNWRIISAARLDKFTHPDKAYLSYQFASTYKLNENNLIRAVVARSNSGSFVGPTYLDVEIVYPVPNTPFNGINRFAGNENLALYTQDLFEIGYRTKINSRIELNVEAFRQIGNNFYSLVAKPIPPQFLAPASDIVEIENLPIEAVQTGVTVSANVVSKKGFQFKPFFTYQSTMARNFPSGLNHPDLNPTENIEITSDEKHNSTPSFFGGAYLNFKLGKWNLNMNPYFMSAYQIYNVNDIRNETNIGKIDNLLLLNARASYQVTNNLSLYVNGRNISNNTSRQFYGTDTMGAMVLGGLNLRIGN